MASRPRPGMKMRRHLGGVNPRMADADPRGNRAQRRAATKRGIKPTPLPCTCPTTAAPRLSDLDTSNIPRPGCPQHGGAA